MEEALIVMQYVQTRPEQKYVRIVNNCPRTRADALYSLVTDWLELSQ